jgi:NitT/TauT family transport system substrate-binding protein
VAADKGYFKQEGLDVEFVPMTNTATFVQAVALNQVSFAITNPDPVIFNAIDRGVDVRAIASSTVNQKGDHPAQFMVRQDLVESGKYKQASDLKGMNVAAGAANAQFYVDRFLGSGGLTLKDVNVVNVGVQDVLASFRNKGIDAGWETEPLATQAEKQALAKTVALTGDLFPGAVAGVLLMSPQFGQEQPDGARHFAIAYLRGLRDYYHAFNKKDSADRAPIIQSLIAHTPVKDPALYDVIGLPSFEPNGAVDPTPSWGVFQDFFVKQGLQQRKVDVAKYVDFAFINSAIDRLGRES